MIDKTENVPKINNSFIAVHATFIIDGFDPEKHLWNRWIQCMEGSF